MMTYSSISKVIIITYRFFQFKKKVCILFLLAGMGFQFLLVKKKIKTYLYMSVCANIFCKYKFHSESLVLKIPSVKHILKYYTQASYNSPA